MHVVISQVTPVRSRGRGRSRCRRFAGAGAGAGVGAGAGQEAGDSMSVWRGGNPWVKSGSDRNRNKYNTI